MRKVHKIWFYKGSDPTCSQQAWRPHQWLQMVRKTFVWLNCKHCVSQCQCDYSGTSPRHTFLAVLGIGILYCPRYFLQKCTLLWSSRINIQKMNSDNKIKFANTFKTLLETLLKLLSSKNRARKVKDYKERKQAMFQNICEKNLKLLVFKLFLSSFINLFAHSNPQENKTQILTKSLHRIIFNFACAAQSLVLRATRISVVSESNMVQFLTLTGNC